MFADVVIWDKTLLDTDEILIDGSWFAVNWIQDSMQEWINPAANQLFPISNPIPKYQ